MLSVEQMEDIKAQAYAGCPSELKGVCKIYPSMMKDFLEIGPAIFSGRLRILLLTENQIVDIIKKNGGEKIEPQDINPLEFLLQSADKNDGFFLELKKAFSTFIKEEILFIPKINSVLIGNDPAAKRLITKDNFSDFQTILRIQNREKVPTPPPPNESAIAKKMRLLAEYRDEVKRKQEQKSGESLDIAELLEIGEVFGINYKEKSVYAFYGLLQRHQLKEKWDQDLAMLCAGAKSEDVKPSYWAITKKEK